MQTILKIPGFTDNIFTHLLAGLGAGLFAVCIGSPIDVVGFLSPLPVSAKNNSLAAPNVSMSFHRLQLKCVAFCCWKNNQHILESMKNEGI